MGRAGAVAYGIPFPSPRERFERLDEQLAIITGLWRTPVGDTFSFDGAHSRLVDCPALPKPIQQPHPPVIVGGTGLRRTPTLAARYADEFNLPPFEGPEAAGAAFAHMRATCEAIGRDPETIELSVTLTTVCGADRAETERRGEVHRSSSRWPISPARPTRSSSSSPLPRGRATRAYLRLLDLRDVDHIALLGEAG